MPRTPHLHFPMNRLTKIAEVTRVLDNRGNTVYFTIPGKTERSSLDLIDREKMPPFDGAKAWFEFELIRARPWPYWHPVRQVEPPTH